VTDTLVVSAVSIVIIHGIIRRGKQMNDRFLKTMILIIVAVLVWATIMLTITTFYEILR
jgi:hypothetical protein